MDKQLAAVPPSTDTAVVLPDDVNNRPKPKPKKTALEEDEFTEAIGKIIRRDFFPDLPKLEAQLAFIEATESNDVDKLREISERYPTHFKTPSATPSTFQTPVPNSSSQQQNKSKPLDQPCTSAISDNDTKPEDSKSLDVFLNHYYSEDDASFDNIMELEEERRLQKYAWMYEREKIAKDLNSNVPALTSGDGPQLAIEGSKQLSITDGSERDGRGQIKMWDYTAKNTLMYIPDGAQESTKELIAKKKNKIIKHSNTRLSSEFLRKMSSVKGGGVEGFVPDSAKEKVGIDGKQLNVSESPQVGGYGFVATPQIRPGVDASPMMTWGTIEGTPLHLDTDIVATPGPVFKIPKTPRREVLAHRLAEKASKGQSEKRKFALEKTSLLIKSPGGRMTPGTAERLKLLSPAARKLVSSPAGVGIFRGTDKSLRASYTPKSKVTAPSPRHSKLSTTNTATKPSHQSSSTPSNTTCTSHSLTDNLLDLR